MESRKIIYLGWFRIDNLDAAGLRILDISKILRTLGHHVKILSPEQGRPDVAKSIEGFTYYNISEIDNSTNSPFKKIINFFQNGKKTIAWLENYIKKNNIDIVFIYNGSGIYVNRIKNFCDGSGIKIIGDVTEWYDANHLPGGRLGIVNIDNIYKMNILYKKFNNMMFISKYLHQYYRDIIKNTTVIPILVDENEKQNVKTELTTGYKNNKNRNIMYIGSPGLKDDLKLVVEAFINYDINENTILHLVGITSQQFIRTHPSMAGKITNNILFYGRLSRDECLNLYQLAHASIIIRPNKRYANAGFPTKLAESISMGVPVISTDTSDVKDYINNGYNGYIIKFDYDQLCKAINNISNMTINDWLIMKNNTLSSKKKLSMKKFSNEIEKFIHNIQ